MAVFELMRWIATVSRYRQYVTASCCCWTRPWSLLQSGLEKPRFYKKSF